MSLVHILIVVNYVIAIYALIKITNDDVWGEIINSMLDNKDIVEQQSLIEHSDTLRKTMCALLIIPGVGIVLAIVFVKMFLNF